MDPEMDGWMDGWLLGGRKEDQFCFFYLDCLLNFPSLNISTEDLLGSQLFVDMRSESGQLRASLQHLLSVIKSKGAAPGQPMMKKITEKK